MDIPKARHRDVSDQSLYKICIVGLGYVGLPLATEFDQAGYDVVGFDIDEDKINQLKTGQDPTNDVGAERVERSDIDFTTDTASFTHAEYVIITVPTPVDELKKPNLKYVERAGELVGHTIRPGTKVVLESTVYPGATREILGPAIERTSELEAGEGFYLGYSPERLVPGDEDNGFRDIVKIVSAENDTVLTEIAELYESVVDAGVHRAPSLSTSQSRLVRTSAC